MSAIQDIRDGLVLLGIAQAITVISGVLASLPYAPFTPPPLDGSLGVAATVGFGIALVLDGLGIASMVIGVKPIIGTIFKKPTADDK